MGFGVSGVVHGRIRPGVQEFGLSFRFESLGFRVQGLGLRVCGMVRGRRRRLGVWGSEFRVQGSGSGV